MHSRSCVVLVVHGFYHIFAEWRDTLTVILRTFPYGNMVEDWSYFMRLSFESKNLL